MRQVGTIREIWRYPVKGMAGESVQSCLLGESGLAGDRIWAIRDEQRDEIQSCKFRPDLLRCTASWRNGARVSPEDPVDILFPDGTVQGSDDPTVHASLTALTRHPSRLEPLLPDMDLARFRRYKANGHAWLEELKATFEREEGEPLPDFSDMPQNARDYVSMPGTFFLVAPIHVITTATMTCFKQIDPDSDWDLRRFRPNLVIETLPEYEGFAEQAWVGRQLALGDIVLDCTDTTPRCGATARAQRDFGEDKGVLRTVVQRADQNLGIYGQASGDSQVRVGDPVWLHG